MNYSKFKVWIEATRPKTLAASFVPVLIGTVMATYENYFNFTIFLLTSICALLIQIITNFVNEVYDFKKGVDNTNRLGPRRVVASGLIQTDIMIKAIKILFFIALMSGMILVFMGGGIIIFIVGSLSLVFAFFYSGGPYPLAYKGISDIFVLIFFGIVAVTGTYYLQTQKLTLEIFIASLAPGFLSMNILGVNNIRDIETDKNAGKITLAIILGEQASKILYVFLNFLAFLVPIVLFIITKNIYFLSPLLVFPISIVLCVQLFNSSGKNLNKILAQTGGLLFLYGISTLTLLLAK
ncbi:MAG: 1,4-dihydroxy-2-naphthoate polyprenyltransferase [Ignavibacteria bacterium]